MPISRKRPVPTIPTESLSLKVKYGGNRKYCTASAPIMVTNNVGRNPAYQATAKTTGNSVIYGRRNPTRGVISQRRPRPSTSSANARAYGWLTR
jgi:hypothetical protein